MADIIKIPNKILSNKTELAKVKDIKDGSFKELILEMRRSMKDHQGIGLAANQIGKNISIFVIEPILAQESGIQDVYINPEITEYSKDEDRLKSRDSAVAEPLGAEVHCIFLLNDPGGQTVRLQMTSRPTMIKKSKMLLIRRQLVFEIRTI